jgi:mRNA interferase YafQ
VKYAIQRTAKFRRDVKKAEKQGRDLAALKTVVALLADGESLPPKYRDHALRGHRRGFRECHIAPDWLLIYAIHEGRLVLLLAETGSHTELLGI